MCLPVNPYKVEREWQAHGLSCAVTMNRQAGFRCGYVRVPPGHPAHGKNYNDGDWPMDVRVHGGLTLSELEPCTEHADGQGHWFGFDCGHAGDATHDLSIPDSELDAEAMRWREVAREFPMLHSPEHYWTQAEVEAECERLAEQLAAMAGTP